MGIFIGKTENLLLRRLGLLAGELKASANNIANANVPSYTAKRVDFSTILRQEKTKLSLSRTNPRHISNENIPQPEIKIIDTKKPVEIDQEILNMTRVSLDYQTMIKLLSNRFRLYSSIISERVE